LVAELPSNRDIDRRIVEALLNHGRLTLPRLTKILGSNVGTVDYHLRKLAERGIILVDKKRYGSTYSLNGDLISVDRRVYFGMGFSAATLIAGVLLLVQNPFCSAVLFLVSSLIGLFFIVKEYKRQSRERLRELLDRL